MGLRAVDALMLMCPREGRASKHPALMASPFEADEVGHFRVREN